MANGQTTSPNDDPKQFRPKLVTFSDVAGIAAGAVCTGRLDTVKSIHELHFICRAAAGAAMTTAQVTADVGNIRILANGVVIRDYTAQECIELWGHYNDAKAANAAAVFPLGGMIPVTYTRREMDLNQYSNALAFGMLSNGKPVNLTYEITITAVAVLAQIQVRAIVDDRIMEVGPHIRITPSNWATAAAGQFDWTTIPVTAPGGRKVLAYHLHDPAAAAAAERAGYTAAIGALFTLNVVKNNEEQLYQQATIADLDFMLRQLGRCNFGNWIHIPFDYAADPRGGEILGSNVASWLVQPTFTAVGAGGVTRLLDEYITNGLGE